MIRVEVTAEHIAQAAITSQRIGTVSAYECPIHLALRGAIELRPADFWVDCGKVDLDGGRALYLPETAAVFADQFDEAVEHGGPMPGPITFEIDPTWQPWAEDT